MINTQNGGRFSCHFVVCMFYLYCVLRVALPEESPNYANGLTIKSHLPGHFNHRIHSTVLSAASKSYAIEAANKTISFSV